MNKLRRPLIAGNWKMHEGGPGGLDLAVACVALAKEAPGVDIVIAPPFTLLAAAASVAEDTPLSLAAQNIHFEPNGAFTGEVSAEMVAEAGCSWVIIGHSERRTLFGETDELVAQKVDAARRAGLRPIVCVGESLDEREAGKTEQVVRRQVAAVSALLATGPLANGMPAAVAYEPVWAIGTGKTATPEQAQEVHAWIRGWLGEVSTELADLTRVLYGGSVKPDNAAELLTQPDIDGALIGGASLKADSFSAIARAAVAELTRMGVAT